MRKKELERLCSLGVGYTKVSGKNIGPYYIVHTKFEKYTPEILAKIHKEKRNVIVRDLKDIYQRLTGKPYLPTKT